MRCWNIPDQKVVDWADVHEMVTAATFSSEGSRAVVGTMRGKCRFYQVDTSFRLEYQAQIGQPTAFLPSFLPSLTYLPAEKACQKPGCGLRSTIIPRADGCSAWLCVYAVLHNRQTDNGDQSPMLISWPHRAWEVYTAQAYGQRIARITLHTTIPALDCSVCFPIRSKRSQQMHM